MCSLFVCLFDFLSLSSRLTIAASNPSNETYVSQEVCTSIIHEAKGSIKRAKAVSQTSHQENVATQVMHCTVADG